MACADATSNAAAVDACPTPPSGRREPGATTEAPPTKSVLKLELGAHTFRAMGGSESDDFNNVILRETMVTVWIPGTENDGQAKRVRAVIAALKAFKPKDEIEGMLAAQAVALHFGAMECFRRAMMRRRGCARRCKRTDTRRGLSSNFETK